jgi:hypothetical protein
MTTKSILGTLLVTAAVFGPACGTALAGNDRVADTAAGYVYPNFWGEASTNQQSNAATAPQGDGDGASVDIYVTEQHDTGTYLFPPNPNQ